MERSVELCRRMCLCGLYNRGRRDYIDSIQQHYLPQNSIFLFLVGHKNSLFLSSLKIYLRGYSYEDNIRWLYAVYHASSKQVWLAILPSQSSTSE